MAKMQGRQGLERRRWWGSGASGIVPLALGIALLAIGGCASSGTGDREAPRDRDVITRSQLEGLDHLSAYEAVRRLRPVWLRTGRGADSFDAGIQGRRGVRVYRDGAYVGLVDELRQIPVREIQEIRYLDPRQATMRFGTDHTDGALLVTTR